MMSLSC